ncbi:MAG: DUF421 domain-containing protein [Clostridia bacterium]|nr:DUF421 domain-containing protein [Clostridia bacterium]
MNKLGFVGYQSILELDYVILETSGQISVVPKAEEKAVTIKDMQLKPVYNGYTRPIIMDGIIIESNLKELGYDDNWLSAQLKKYKLEVKNTLLFTVDELGNVYCQERGETK